MKYLGIAITLSACAGSVQALPPVLTPSSVTTNVAVGAVGAPDPGSGNNRLSIINNSSGGGQLTGGLPQRSINVTCPMVVSCFSQATTSGGFFPSPFANATAFVNLNGTVPDSLALPQMNTQVGGFSSVTLQYQFAVSGPVNTTAFVDLASFMQISGGGVSGALQLAGGAGFRVIDPSGSTWVATQMSTGIGLFRQTRDLLGNIAVAGYQPGPSSGVWLENEIVPFSSNTAYTISLFATASATAQVVIGPNAAQGSAAGFVDPHLTIDPMTPNAAAYSILLSDGVGNAAPVPEPASPALWAAGLLVLGGLRRRQVCRQLAFAA